MLDLLKLQQEFLFKSSRYAKPSTTKIDESGIEMDNLRKIFAETINTESFQKHLNNLGLSSLKNSVNSEEHDSRLENIPPHIIIGIDGSQIYPSRHENISKIGLTKTAAVIFDYKNPEKSLFEKTTSYKTYFPEEIFEILGTEVIVSNALFDCLRQLDELRMAVKMAEKFQDQKNVLILLDASLNLVFLQTIKQNLASIILAQYAKLVTQLKALNVPLFSYLSWPSSNNIASTLRRFYCSAKYFDREVCIGKCKNETCKLLALKNDAELFTAVLKNRQTSPVFQSLFLEDCAAQDLSIPFFYLSTSTEVAQIDFCLSKLSLLEINTGFLLDQHAKGFGYPLALAEAHVAADIDHTEKTFFSELVNQAKIISPKQKSKNIIFG